jgi:hypothetical protein
VGKFIGTGKEQSGLTELHNVQTAMMAMMADTETANVTATAPTNDMSAFPSGPTSLYGAIGEERYTVTPTTEYWYSCETDGTVHGYWDAGGTLKIGEDDPP